MKKRYVFLALALLLSALFMVYGCGSSSSGGGGGSSLSAWIYVSDTNNKRIIVIDGTTNSTVEPIALDQNPGNIAASPDGKKIYCSTNDGRIYSIDTSTNTSVDAFITSPAILKSFGMIVSHDNKYLYLTCPSTTELVKVDLTTAGYPYSSALLRASGGRIALNSDSTKAYVCVAGASMNTETTLEVVNTSTMTIEASLNVVNHPYDIVIKDDYAYLAISSAIDSVARIKLSNNAVDIITITPPVFFHGVASIPGQDKLYFCDQNSPGQIMILKPSKFPTMETTAITSTELTYPERITATPNFAYVVDGVPDHNKVVVIDVNTDQIVKYIQGLAGDNQYSNPVVVYK